MKKNTGRHLLKSVINLIRTSDQMVKSDTFLNTKVTEIDMNMDNKITVFGQDLNIKMDGISKKMVAIDGKINSLKESDSNIESKLEEIISLQKVKKKPRKNKLI